MCCTTAGKARDSVTWLVGAVWKQGTENTRAAVPEVVTSRLKPSGECVGICFVTMPCDFIRVTHVFSPQVFLSSPQFPESSATAPVFCPWKLRPLTLVV